MQTTIILWAISVLSMASSTIVFMDNETHDLIQFAHDIAIINKIDPVKLRVLKDRTLEKLQEKDKVIFEKLLNWFEHVQTKFNELFQTFNNHFGQIIKRDEHQAQ